MSSLYSNKAQVTVKPLYIFLDRIFELTPTRRTPFTRRSVLWQIHCDLAGQFSSSTQVFILYNQNMELRYFLCIENPVLYLAPHGLLSIPLVVSYFPLS
jgi:hypothetical protein